MIRVQSSTIIFLTFIALCSVAKEAGSVNSGKGPIPRHEKVCEEILRVEWIARARGLGTFRHKFYSGNKEKLKDFFVYWGVQGPAINYGGMQKKGSRLDSSERNAIEHWDFLPFDRRDGGLEFRDSENLLVIPKHDFKVGSSLGKKMASICIRHPLNSINAIIEFRSAENFLEKNRLISTFFEIKKEIPNFKLTISQFKKTSAMDLNSDSLVDFPELNIYSHLGKYYRLMPAWNSELDPNFGTYVFDGNRRSCFLNDLYPRFYIETKKRILINGTCDIATLTGG